MQHVTFGIPTDKSAPTVQYGVARGVFRREGVDLDVVPYYGGPALTDALEDGRLDFAQIGTPPMLVAANRGCSFRIVGSAIRRKLHLYLGVRRDITDADGLRGATIGLLSMGSCDEWIARALLERHGLDPDKDVMFTGIRQDYARLVELIRDHRIDGALAIEPNISAGEHQGVLRLWGVAFDEPSLACFQWTVLVASERLRTGNPGLVRTLLRAYSESAKLAAEEQDAYCQFLSRQYKIDPDVISRSVERELPHYEFDCRVDRAGLDAAVALQRRLGAIHRPLVGDDIVDWRFQPAH